MTMYFHYQHIVTVLITVGLLAAGAADVVGDSPTSGSKQSVQETGIRFERIPVSSLPRFVHFNGHPRASLLPEDNGSGCAWGDYDGDGDDDLYLCNVNGPLLMDADKRRGFPGSRLWRNDGGGRFTDVTEASGLGESRMDMAALFADFDNDGDADLLVTNLAGVRLFRNDAGRFSEITKQAGLGGVSGYCLGAAWGDYDRDGRLDLYLCRYVDFPIDKARNREIVAGRPAPMTTPSSYPPLANMLFHQEADGTFRDVTATSGTAAAKGRSMQATWCDFDNDGWIDLYVANDQSLDNLFRNKGDGTFEDVGLAAGVFDPRGGMGVAVIDVDADGDQDFLVTHWVSEDPGFYVNELRDGDFFFEDQAIPYGLRKTDLALVGWGVGFEDFDSDGDRDLFVSYGSTIEDELTLDVLKNPKMLPQRSEVYEWRKKRWHALGAAAGSYFGETHVGRGAALADFDRDGRPDIAINNHGGPPALLRNVSKRGGHWLAVKLVGRHCARDAANARVTLIRQGEPPQMRELFIGSSYLSGHTKTLHFGLGSAKRSVDVQVRWPCGRIQRLGNVDVDRTIVISEEQDTKP
ncbi:MAG: CRTAC1 family protein [Planctomycetes bacterium]|nr:CRTAC1 family protein [Planctomycetota bacterium]